MSSIVKLSIQGIRSFGTLPDDKQTIDFSSPVTLILGANGCGKTTIIECLKYAMTGELPPGSGRGQSFIHDPKIFDAIECKGQVKLVVKNSRGENLTITRSMKIGLKRGKQCFETVDTALNYGTEKDNEMHSRRSNNADSEICQFMGVSKAIFNNVILCHQEDSSWPLDEGKKLKEKFDAIFGTSEYNKAIDKFIKLRKDQMEIMKNKAADLKISSYIKKETENKTLELESAQKKQNNLRSNFKELEESLNPISSRITIIYNIEKEIGRVQADRIELATKLKNCTDQIKSLKSKIKNLHDGDISEIDHSIRNFRDMMSKKRTTLEDYEEQLDKIKSEERHLQKALTEIDRKRSTLVHQRQQEQEMIAERAKKTTTLCGSLKIPLNIDLEFAQSGEIELVFNKIKETLKKEENKITEVSVSHDKIDNVKQASIDEFRVRKAAVENNITSKKSQKSQHENEQRKIETEINTFEMNAINLTALTEQIEKVDSTLTEYCKTINFDVKKKEILNKNIEVKRLQENFGKLDKQLTFLNSISNTMAEVKLVENNLTKREQEVKHLKSKHADKMKIIFPSRIIETNFKQNFLSAYDELQRTVKECSAEITKKQLDENQFEISRKNQKDEIRNLEKEFQDSKDMIFDKCHSTPYEELLARNNEIIQKLQLDLGAFKSAESIYKKYIQKIKDDPCCPLCHKGMTSNEATDLSLEISDEIHRLPENINRTDIQLKKELAKYEQLLYLKPVIDKVDNLKDEIPKAKLKLTDTLQKLAVASKELETCQGAITEPAAKLDLVNGMLGDMSLLDEAIKDVTRQKDNLRKLKAKVPEGTSTDSIEDIQLEKTTIAAELSNARCEVETLQAQYEKESDCLNKLRDKRNVLKDRQIRLQEGVQSLPQLKIRCSEIRTSIELLKKDIQSLENELGPLKSELNLAIEEKEALKNKHREILVKMKSQLDSIKLIHRDITRCTNELNTFAELNLVQGIELIENKMKSYKDDFSRKARENSETATKIEKIKIEISNQELLERDLRDNRELKELMNKLELLQQQTIELAKNFGELDHKNITLEKEQLIKKRDIISESKGELLGQIGEIGNQIRKIETELNDPKYKDSVMNYRKTFYEVEVLKKIVWDLNQYRDALERALMKFHAEKMEKINKLIREYWRQIYKGNDIDYIQIQTIDEGKSDTEISVADKRRNYNYRVIQSKNHSKIDMRGRCSAGQRVLASLIIRMALAETFSNNCGVLALDEPTTNLDRKNILSLCEALNRIVEERPTQNNFMLIIITHDEEFISTLGKIRSYRTVFRNQKGLSVIRKVRIAD